jgi:hypothetical protein
VLLDDDPLVDIRDARQVRAVVTGGRLVTRISLVRRMRLRSALCCFIAVARCRQFRAERQRVVVLGWPQ